MLNLMPADEAEEPKKGHPKHQLHIYYDSPSEPPLIIDLKDEFNVQAFAQQLMQGAFSGSLIDFWNHTILINFERFICVKHVPTGKPN